METHSSVLAWRIPWMEEPGGLQSTGSEESDTTERFHFHFQVPCIIPTLSGNFLGKLLREWILFTYAVSLGFYLFGSVCFIVACHFWN